MTFEEILDQAIGMLQRRGRVTYRALQRHFNLDEAFLDDLKEELIHGQQLVVDEDGKVLVWVGRADQASARVGTQLVHRPARSLVSSVHKEIIAMTPYVQHVRFRKFSPVDREYPIFELVEGDDVLLDVSVSDDEVLEVAVHEASIGKIFKLDDLHAILIQGKRLLEEEMAYES